MPDTLLKRIELAVRHVATRILEGSGQPVVLANPRSVVPVGRPMRVLFLRQDRLGDVLVSEPVIRAIREKYPSAQIDMLLSPNNIAARHALTHLIDDVVLYRKQGWGVMAAIRQIRRNRYDVIVDLMDNPSATSTLLLRASGIAIRIGIDKTNRAVYSHVVSLLDRSSVHIVERIAQLAMPFGIDPSTMDLRLRYRLTDLECAEAQHHLAAGGRRTAMFNVTGSDDARRYGSERWIRVISVFRQRNPDWRAIVAGAPHDEATLQRIAGATGADILPTTVSFHAFAATVMQATLLVTADTSIVHVAAAASVPQVVLYVFNNPALMPWYPYRSPHVALTGYNNVREIEPAHVNDAIEALFSCIATT